MPAPGRFEPAATSRFRPQAVGRVSPKRTLNILLLLFQSVTVPVHIQQLAA